MMGSHRSLSRQLGPREGREVEAHRCPPPCPQVGQWAEFTWQFLGLGNTTCAVDGRPVSNDPATGQCSSPLRIKVPDGQRHRLVVTFRDVCGTARDSAMNFSVTEGWTTDAMADPAGGAGLGINGAPDALMPAAAPLALPQRLVGERARSASGGARPRSSGAALAALAAAAAAALLL
jgi:hypothetical protein